MTMRLFPIYLLLTTSTLAQQIEIIKPRHEIRSAIKTAVTKEEITSVDADWSVYSDIAMQNALSKIKIGDSVEVTGWAPWLFFIKSKSLNGYIPFRALPFWTNPMLDSLADVIVRQSPIEDEAEERKQKDIKEKKNEQMLIKKFGNTIAHKIINGHYWIGMTNEMAEYSLGRPDKINRTVTSNSYSKQWVYTSVYLYFRNGILESYQDKR